MHESILEYPKGCEAFQSVGAEKPTLVEQQQNSIRCVDWAIFCAALGCRFLESSTELIQSDKKQVVWTAEELDRARIILNRMYDTEQAELDVLMSRRALALAVTFSVRRYRKYVYLGCECVGC